MHILRPGYTNNYGLLCKITKNRCNFVEFFNENANSSCHSNFTDHFQCLHDIRMVWSSEDAGAELDLKFHTPRDRYPHFVGYSAARIFLSGAGQPYGFSWQRRPFLPHAA